MKGGIGGGGDWGGGGGWSKAPLCLSKRDLLAYEFDGTPDHARAIPYSCNIKGGIATLNNVLLHLQLISDWKKQENNDILVIAFKFSFFHININ